MPSPLSDLRFEARLECHSQPSFNRWLADLAGSLAITTHQAGMLALLGWGDGQPSLLVRKFDRPTGLAADHDHCALATRCEIIQFANADQAAAHTTTDRYDALYLPRVTHHTGELNVQDMAFGNEGLWFVNSRFSCLCGLSTEFSFVPRWQPSFVSEMAPEDRCHLNGMAMVNGEPKYVTAFGETDTLGGWREHEQTGGILVDVETNEVLLRGLSRPHSPRWHNGQLYLLNSGAGELLCVDPVRGTSEVVCILPGYLRGLQIIDGCAVIGMSQGGGTQTAGRLRVQERFEQLVSGLALVDLKTGALQGTFEFISGCKGIFEVSLLPQTRHPNFVGTAQETSRLAFTAPDDGSGLRSGKKRRQISISTSHLVPAEPR